MNICVAGVALLTLDRESGAGATTLNFAFRRQKSSPGSGSWEPDYAFRSLSRILFIFRRVMFDDAYRREYSDQSKAILQALELTIESADPPCLCSRSSRKSAILEICFF